MPPKKSRLRDSHYCLPNAAGLAGSLEETVDRRLPRQRVTRKRMYAHCKEELANC